jgi:hypothetical protein
MSEPEKKGSIWPWIIVPLGAFAVFFLLRECQRRLPPAERVSPAASVSAPEPAPAPQTP